MSEVSKSSGKAITSLVLGLLSLVCSFVAGIPAVIFGFLALSDIKASQARLTGQGMAIAGIVLGFFGSALAAIGILIALLLPAVQMARQAARRAVSTNNMRQIGLALHTKADQTRAFPAQYTVDAAGKPGTSWRVQLLPYLEANALFQLYHMDEPWNSPGNLQALATLPPQFVNPVEEAATNSSPPSIGYVAVASPGFVFDGETPCKLTDIKDGLSNTIMIVDVLRSGIALAEPRDLSWDEFLSLYQSRKVGGDYNGFLGLTADGAAVRIPYDLDPEELRAYFTIDGGEKVTPPALHMGR